MCRSVTVVRTILVALLSLVGCSCREQTPALPEQPPPVRPGPPPLTVAEQLARWPIDHTTTKAWTFAGFQDGWMVSTGDGWGDWTNVKPEGKRKPLPAFHRSSLEEVGKLPAPSVPFGLDFRTAINISEQELQDLAGLKQLRALNLSYTKLRDAHLKGIAGLDQLESLDLSGTPINDAALQHLAGLKNLRRLSLFRCLSVRDEGLKHLDGLQNLVELNLFSTNVYDRGHERIGKYKQLKRLGCGNTSNEGLAHLAGLVDLEGLDAFGGMNDDGLKHLVGLKKLRRLALQGSKFSLAALLELESAPHLEFLSIRPISLTAGVERFKQLTYLALDQCGTTDAELKHVATLRQLQVLTLPGNKITDAGLKELVALDQLMELDITENAITDAGLKHLAALPGLKVLIVGPTKEVTSAGVEVLKKARPGLVVHVRPS